MFEKWADKINKRLQSEEEIKFKDYEKEEEAEAPKAEAAPQGSTLKAQESERDGAGAIELKVVRPESFEEVTDIADHLLNGCTVVLNLELLDKPVSLRMLDFLNGVTYTTDGDIKPVAQNTYVITPHDVDVSDE
jgi:cell division inhibitor SepF